MITRRPSSSTEPRSISAATIGELLLSDEDSNEFKSSRVITSPFENSISSTPNTSAGVLIAPSGKTDIFNVYSSPDKITPSKKSVTTIVNGPGAVVTNSI